MRSARRPSTHEEPRGALAVTRHYIGDLIYGANDGLITTFAVVAAASGGALSRRTVAGLEMLALGIAVALAAYISGAIISELVGGSD